MCAAALALVLAMLLLGSVPLGAQAAPYIDEIYIGTAADSGSLIPTAGCNGSTGQGMSLIPTKYGTYVARSYLVPNADATVVLYDNCGSEVCRLSDPRFIHANSLSYNPSAGVLYLVPRGITAESVALITIAVYHRDKQVKVLPGDEGYAYLDENGERDKNASFSRLDYDYDGESEDAGSDEDGGEYVYYFDAEGNRKRGKVQYKTVVEWGMYVEDEIPTAEFPWPMNVSYSNGMVYGIDQDSNGALAVARAAVGEDGRVDRATFSMTPVGDPWGIGLEGFMSRYGVGQSCVVDPSGRYIMDVRFSASPDSSFPVDANGNLMQAICVVDLETNNVVNTCGISCVREVEDLSYTSGGSLVAATNGWTGPVQVLEGSDTGVYWIQTPDFYRGWDIVVSQRDALEQITSGNPLYSLSDAVVGVFADRECAFEVGAAWSGPDGTTFPIHVGNPGRYFLRLKEASSGYVLDGGVSFVDCSPWRDEPITAAVLDVTPAYAAPTSLIEGKYDRLRNLTLGFVPKDKRYVHRFVPDMTGYFDEGAAAEIVLPSAGDGSVPFAAGTPVEGEWPYTVDGKNVVPLGTAVVESVSPLGGLFHAVGDDAYICHVIQRAPGEYAEVIANPYLR